jgi:hypothetical protein
MLRKEQFAFYVFMYASVKIHMHVIAWIVRFKCSIGQYIYHCQLQSLLADSASKD